MAPPVGKAGLAADEANRTSITSLRASTAVGPAAQGNDQADGQIASPATDSYPQMRDLAAANIPISLAGGTMGNPAASTVSPSASRAIRRSGWRGGKRIADVDSRRGSARRSGVSRSRSGLDRREGKLGERRSACIPGTRFGGCGTGAGRPHDGVKRIPGRAAHTGRDSDRGRSRSPLDLVRHGPIRASGNAPGSGTGFRTGWRFRCPVPYAAKRTSRDRGSFFD